MVASASLPVSILLLLLCNCSYPLVQAFYPQISSSRITSRSSSSKRAPAPAHHATLLMARRSDAPGGGAADGTSGSDGVDDTGLSSSAIFATVSAFASISASIAAAVVGGGGSAVMSDRGNDSKEAGTVDRRSSLFTMASTAASFSATITAASGAGGVAVVSAVGGAASAVYQRVLSLGALGSKYSATAIASEELLAWIASQKAVAATPEIMAWMAAQKQLRMVRGLGLVAGGVVTRSRIGAATTATEVAANAAAANVATAAFTGCREELEIEGAVAEEGKLDSAATATVTATCTATTKTATNTTCVLDTDADTIFLSSDMTKSSDTSSSEEASSRPSETLMIEGTDIDDLSMDSIGTAAHIE